jgi:hypothetical protein
VKKHKKAPKNLIVSALFLVSTYCRKLQPYYNISSYIYLVKLKNNDYYCITILKKRNPTMTKENAIRLFNDAKIRVHWDEEKEKWYFSIVDVVGVLTESPNPNNYWKVLKHRLAKEGSELVTKCN